MPNVASILDSPRFQALPPERQRAMLSAMQKKGMDVETGEMPEAAPDPTPQRVENPSILSKLGRAVKKDPYGQVIRPILVGAGGVGAQMLTPAAPVAGFAFGMEGTNKGLEAIERATGYRTDPEPSVTRQLIESGQDIGTNIMGGKFFEAAAPAIGGGLKKLMNLGRGASDVISGGVNTVSDAYRRWSGTARPRSDTSYSVPPALPVQAPASPVQAPAPQLMPARRPPLQIAHDLSLIHI